MERGTLLNWLLVAAIAVGGTVAIVTVIVNASASTQVSAEAERSLLIADMQSAVQVESEAAALFVAHLPASGTDGHHGGESEQDTSVAGQGADSVHPDDPGSGQDLTDHPDVLAAAAAFSEAAMGARALGGTVEDLSALDSAVYAHAAFIGTIESLNDAAHEGESAMAVYHNDTQLAEAGLRGSIQRLRDLAAEGLAAAIERTERSQDLLTLMLPVAAGASLFAAIGLFLSRSAWRRVRFLEELVSEKDRFIGTVSHELRTPLAAIVGFTELLAAEDTILTASEQREYLALVSAQGNEVSAIVEDLLVAARAEIGELTIVEVSVDLAAQLRQVLETLDVPEGPVVVSGRDIYARADPVRVRQILRNLLTNAVRHGGSGIHVELDAGEGRASVRVVDNGDPIPDSDRDRIFEPYATLGNNRPVTGSIGLGLAVSRQLAVLMGGSLAYEYQDGQSVFALTLPSMKGDVHFVGEPTERTAVEAVASG